MFLLGCTLYVGKLSKVLNTINGIAHDDLAFWHRLFRLLNAAVGTDMSRAAGVESHSAV